MATYQIVAECAYVTTDTQFGRRKTLLYKGALVPENAPELDHLLASGMAVEVSDDETGGVDAEGRAAGELTKGRKRTTSPSDTPNTETTSTPSPDEGDETAAQRQAAQEKLAALGDNPPDGRHSKDVLVEYLVKQGGSYDDLVKATKADLAEMVKSRQG